MSDSGERRASRPAGADPFEQLVEQSPFGILTVDSALRIRHVSAGARTTFQRIDTLVGRDLEEVLRLAWPEAFAATAIAIVKRTLETGERYLSPGPARRRTDPASFESCGWQTSRLTLPEGGDGVVCHFVETTPWHRSDAANGERERRFRDFTNATPDASYRMSPDWTEMRYLQGRGFVADTLQPSRTWLSAYVPTDDQASVTAAIGEAIRLEAVFELEHRVIRSDGTIGWTSSRAIPVLDDDGNLVEWFGSARDITSRKAAEAALSRSEQRYRTLVDSIDEGFCIIDMIYDEAGRPVDYRFVEINPAFAKHTGLTGAQGRTIRELVPNQEAHWFTIYGKVAATGEPVRFENRGEGMHRWFDVFAFRLDGAGSQRVAVLFSDITERKLAALAADRARKYAEATLRTSPVPLLVLERDLRVATANEAFYEHFQVSADETVGRPLHQLGNGQWDVAGLQNQLSGILHGHVSLSDLEVTHDFEHLGRRTMLLTARRMDVEEGGPERIVLVIDDISDRKVAEEALRDADRRKDEFLAMLAHELRNPLAPIRTGLEVIRLAGDSATAVARVRATMERQVGHMVRLIDDLLDVSRITSGKIQLQRTPTLLSDLVGSALDANRAALDAAGVDLSIVIPDTPCVLDVDPTRMVQVLSNLLHNAGKFTPQGGRIVIAAECHGPNERGGPGQLALRVTDDGIGISQEMLPRVFDLFMQGEQIEGQMQPGLGIGLALGKRLVEMHDGEIEARSEGRGRGSTFTIRLPIASPVVAAPLPLAALAAQTVTRRVLVIDDNEDAARMMAMLVEELGSRAQVAPTGEAGLRAVAEFRPEVVLLDIGMPGMDGYDTCRHIRRGPHGDDLFIVAVTGWGQEQDKRRALDAGFDAHLTKPADPTLLERLLVDPCRSA